MARDGHIERLGAAELAAAAARLRRLPRVVHELEFAGRDWEIEAVADQSALAAAADDFPHFPFGLLLWDSAPVLAAALAERPGSLAGRRVLELGAGVGLAGLVAATSGAAEVLQTDHGAEALALCAANAARNSVAGVAWALADWRTWQATDRFDVILGSDILYDSDLHLPLLSVLRQSLAPGGRVLLADPGRSTAPAFLAAMEQSRWTLERRRRRVPALQPIRPGETVMVTLVVAQR